MTALYKGVPEDLAKSSVVIVDDQSTSRNILSEIVKTIDTGISVKAFQSAPYALTDIAISPPDLIITDYKMPDMDGIEFVQKIRQVPDCHDIPIIMVTILDKKSILYRALECGVTDFLNKPFDRIECTARCKNLLTLGKHQTKLREKKEFLEQKVTESTEEILARERETLQRLTTACEYKDCVTGKHLYRIGRLSRLIGLELGLSEEQADILEIASPLHDIGKIAIPDEILLRKGRLSNEEFETMKTHTTIGYNILKDSPSPYLQMGATIALNHHEKYDGTGYPNGIAADEIPIEARIVAVADVFDSLTNHRPYKKAWPLDETLIYIKSVTNKHLDPDCVAALLSKTDQ